MAFIHHLAWRIGDAIIARYCLNFHWRHLRLDNGRKAWRRTGFQSRLYCLKCGSVHWIDKRKEYSNE